MNNKEVSKKQKKNFVSSFVVVQLFILYITLNITDGIILASDGEGLGIRYISVAIVTAISVFLSICSHLKQSTRDEYENVNKMSKILPAAVALILLCYGLFSVASNVREMEKEIKEDPIFDLYQEYDEDGDIDDFFEEFGYDLDEIKNEARMGWVITSIVYLVVAEAVALLAVKKSEGNIVYYDNTESINENEYNFYEQQEENDQESHSQIEEDSQEQRQENNPIKFDL